MIHSSGHQLGLLKSMVEWEGSPLSLFGLFIIVLSSLTEVVDLNTLTLFAQLMLGIFLFD